MPLYHLKGFSGLFVERPKALPKKDPKKYMILVERAIRDKRYFARIKFGNRIGPDKTKHLKKDLMNPFTESFWIARILKGPHKSVSLNFKAIID